jgi:hypothetical protein
MTIYFTVAAGALIGIAITLYKQRNAAAQAEADRRFLEEYRQNKKDLKESEIMIVKLTVLIAFNYARDGLSRNEVFINLLSSLDENGTPQARIPSEMKAQINAGFAIFETDPPTTPEEVFALEVDLHAKLPAGWQA